MKPFTKKTSFPLFAAMAVFLVGCTSSAPHQNFPRRGETGPGPFDATALRDMKTAVEDLVQSMASDGGFMKAYELKRAKKGSIPVIQIGNIENMTDEHVLQKLESARQRLEIAFRKTELFDIADDALSGESISGGLRDSLIENSALGLKDGSNIQHFGEHVSADYQAYGRYRKFANGDRFDYELSLQIIDVETGKKVWSDIAEIEMN